MTGIPFHQEAVNEVVDYQKAGKLYAGIPDRKAIRAIPCWIVEGLDPDELYRYQDPDAENAMIQFPMNWNDVLGNSSHELYDATKSSTPSYYSHFSNTLQTLFFSSWAFVESRAKLLLGELYASDVGSMINSLMLHRAACGIIPGHFKETLWRIIQLGGFPCGWYGGKNGMLAVYIPPVE